MCSECHMEILNEGVIVFLDTEGRQHCRDGPAMIWHDNTQLYFQHGVRHRDGGLPARIFPDGFVEFWVNGVFLRAEYWEDLDTTAH